MRINSLLISVIAVQVVSVAWAHGPGHMVREAGHSALEEAVGVEETGIPGGSGGADRGWGVEATTGWESRHVHYGVNETGNSGAYATELGVEIGGLVLNAWNGFGLGNEFLEWDFSAGYNIELGPVFLMPGYNFRYMPGHVEEGDHGEEHADLAHEGGGEEHGGHGHNTYGNELFLAVGTTAIPYVTPGANFVWDLSNLPGAFLEFRLDGDVPVYKETLSLQPYALLGLNLGYNTTDVYGLNNFQFGAQATCRICEHLSAFTGVNYSVALKALEAVGQENVAWVNVGLSFDY